MKTHIISYFSQSTFARSHNQIEFSTSFGWPGKLRDYHFQQHRQDS